MSQDRSLAQRISGSMEHAAGAPDGHDAAEPVEAAACDVSPGNRPAADDISLKSESGEMGGSSDEHTGHSEEA